MYIRNLFSLSQIYKEEVGGMKFLSVILLICCFSSVYADAVWPSMYIAAGRVSISVIIVGLLIEIGFVKYFTKVSWIKTIIVAIVMNAASATLGSILIAYSGVFGLILSLTMTSIALFGWFQWLISYALAIFINTVVEGITIRLILKLPLSKTYRWLAVVNAITIGICAIYLYLFPIHIH